MGTSFFLVVLPLSKILDYKVPSKWYRRAFGGLEILCGSIMMIVPSRGAKNFANIVLLLMKTLNAYSHWAISDQFERTAPTLVFLLMLSCRLVVDWQLSRKTEDISTPTKDSKTINYNSKAAIAIKKANWSFLFNFVSQALDNYPKRNKCMTDIKLWFLLNSRSEMFNFYTSFGTKSQVLYLWRTDFGAVPKILVALRL